MKTANGKKNQGFCSLISLFFLFLFAVIALAFTSMSQMHMGVSKSYQDVASSQAAAESGLAFADYLVSTYVPPTTAYTMRNSVSQTEAEDTVAQFAQHVMDIMDGSPALSGQGISYDSSSLVIQIPASGTIHLTPEEPGSFSLRFEFVPGDEEFYHELRAKCIGSAGTIERSVQMSYLIKKDSSVLEYAIASRGRIWMTGDTTIDGDVYSDWDNLARSPFNMTSDSKVLGTINTVFTKEQVDSASWQLETLDEDGNPLYDDEGNKIVGGDDEIQGQHEGINYGAVSDVPGMSIYDYNTDEYNQGLTTLPPCPTSKREVEYFPHAAGNYNYPRDGSPSRTWNRRLTRHVYEDQTFVNVRLPDNYNALFRRCVFEGILYIDCYKSASSYYNNVRFEDCTFRGPIITDTPRSLKWKENALYFTGSATFQNTSMAEATILAPNFNVNLGNTNPIGDAENVLTGAVVGGIVDVRGNAKIYGTIVSMCDTSAWTSGYVTNIGATLNDGGSETTELGDIGTILIKPDKKNMLPSGIKTPIVLSRDGSTFTQL